MRSYPLPLPVRRAISKLGRDVSVARRRRRLTQGSLAERAGVGLNTLRRLEKGDPKIALEGVARVLHVLGETDRLAQLLDSGSDETGLLMAEEQLPKRVRARTTSGAL